MRSRTCARRSARSAARPSRLTRRRARSSSERARSTAAAMSRSRLAKYSARRSRSRTARRRERAQRTGEDLGSHVAGPSADGARGAATLLLVEWRRVHGIGRGKTKGRDSRAVRQPDGHPFEGAANLFAVESDTNLAREIAGGLARLPGIAGSHRVQQQGQIVRESPRQLRGKRDGAERRRAESGANQRLDQSRPEPAVDLSLTALAAQSDARFLGQPEPAHAGFGEENVERRVAAVDHAAGGGDRPLQELSHQVHQTPSSLRKKPSSKVFTPWYRWRALARASPMRRNVRSRSPSAGSAKASKTRSSNSRSSSR